MALSTAQMEKYISEHMHYENMQDTLVADCDAMVYLMDNCEIAVSGENRFFVDINCWSVLGRKAMERADKYYKEVCDSELGKGERARAYTGLYDFGHTSPEWDKVISLGIKGLYDRIESYAKKETDTKKKRFYDNISRVYSAALRLMERAADCAQEAGSIQMAQALRRLTKHAPATLYEAMVTSLVYYRLQLNFEGTVPRTLGRLDSLFYPFYIKEDKIVANKLVSDYIYEIDSYHIGSNLPFAICGTNECGSSVNELSYAFLNAYKNAHTADIKLHILCSQSTPDDIIESAFEAVRDGKNSIVFMSDEKIIESLVKLGEDPIDARNYHVVGCYECGGDGEITCSCNARVNLPKALELAINGGRDMLTGDALGLPAEGSLGTFEDLYREFLRQTENLCKKAMQVTDIYEENYKYMHSSPLLSGTYTSSLEKGGDIYCDYSAKYNNSSVNALGLATVTDSLCAIKKLVYDDKTLTLSELAQILRDDWKGHEELRLTVKKSFPKFGTADKNADKIAADISAALAEYISGKPNKKGGVYRLGLFSIDWRWEFGGKTAASADGRHCGEPLSQNTSASFGADKDGATSHLISVAAIDASNTPNGAIADIDLHPSAIRGENGIKMAAMSLRTYFRLGGFSVHYNVLNTDVLKKAQQTPEDYPNLQVRLCGWNAKFSSLSTKEQNEFILRSEKN